MLSLLLAVAVVLADPLPDFIVEHDNTPVDHSCRVVIKSGAVVADPDLNGVIHVEADDITIEFAEGSVLRGASADTVGNGDLHFITSSCYRRQPWLGTARRRDLFLAVSAALGQLSCGCVSESSQRLGCAQNES